jgi:hypothetical protein
VWGGGLGVREAKAFNRANHRGGEFRIVGPRMGSPLDRRAAVQGDDQCDGGTPRARGKHDMDVDMRGVRCEERVVYVGQNHTKGIQERVHLDTLRHHIHCPSEVLGQGRMETYDKGIPLLNRMYSAKGVIERRHGKIR